MLEEQFKTRLTLRCRAIGDKYWSTLRTLSISSAAGYEKALASLIHQKDVWHYTGYFPDHEYQIA